MKAIQVNWDSEKAWPAEADEWLQKLKELKLDAKIEEKVSKRNR